MTTYAPLDWRSSCILIAVYFDPDPDGDFDLDCMAMALYTVASATSGREFLRKRLKTQAAVFEIALGAIGDGLFAVGSVKMATFDAVENAQAIAVAGALHVTPIIVKPQPEYDPTANQQV